MNKRSSVKKAKVSPAAPPPRSSPRKNPSAGRKGDDEEVEEKNIWLDTDALSVECGICFMPFETDVFMCTNGHAACAKCCDRMRNCGCCGLPIGDLRCLPAEKMLAEMNTVCKFSKYGCTEVIKYAEKRRHEESCTRAPCGCPVAGCTYRGMLLCSHVLEDHAGEVYSVAYLQSKTVTLRKAVPFLVLVLERAQDSGEGEGNVFLLLNRNGDGVQFERSLSLVCLGPRPEGGVEFSYRMDVRGSVPRALVSMTATAPCVRELEGFEAEMPLGVPKPFWGSSGSVYVSIRIG
ncbi:unnamed protein product [Urochloa humidicola]